MVYPREYLVVFGGLAVLAASWDIRARKIPNPLSVLIAGSGLASCLLAGGIRVALGGLAAGVTTLLLFTPFWLRRAIGGGDLKLAAACAIWVGLPGAPRYLFASCLAGGFLALVCYVLSSAEGRRSVQANVYGLHAPSWPKAAASPGKPLLVPYGVAFAAGALWVLLTR
jgi:prepilin peptidase CpaA